VRPAINVGRSVSRVGGNAQVKGMKKVAGTLKLSLSQYRDLESFASFSSDLDAVSRAQLDRGSRLVELLKQPQYSPFPVEQQIVSVWMGTTGQIDDVPLEDVRRFEREFLDYLLRDHQGILDGIRETGQLSDDTTTALKDAVGEFRRGFEVTGGELLVKDDDPGKRVDEGDVDPEKISRVVRKPPPEQASGGSSSGGAQQG
jgi:F-type H+-transporting ATPase subunit alpha